MNEIQTSTLNAIMDLYQRIAEIGDINSIDELRLILIKRKIEESNDIVDDFGKVIFERAK